MGEEPDVYFISVIQLELKAGKPVRPGQVQARQDEAEHAPQWWEWRRQRGQGPMPGFRLGGMVSGFRPGKPCGCYSRSLRQEKEHLVGSWTSQCGMQKAESATLTWV